MFKAPIALHCNSMFWEKQPSGLDTAGSFQNSHIPSVALSPKWHFCCLFGSRQRESSRIRTFSWNPLTGKPISSLGRSDAS